MLYTPITLFYTSIMLLGVVALALQVVGKRNEKQKPYHNDLDEELSRNISVHSNYVENVPVLLFIIFLLELHGIDGIVIHLLGITLFVSRLSHAYGLLVGEAKEPKHFRWRVYGMFGTFFVYLIGAFLGLTLIVQAVLF